MKIAFLANQGDVGGGEVMLLAMADAARCLGHDVTIIAPQRPEQLASLAAASGHTTVRLPVSSTAGYLRRLRAWASASDADVVWCNGLRPAFATGGLPRRVVHLHQEPAGKQSLLARAARVRAEIVLVPSRFMAGRVPGARVLENWVEAPEGGAPAAATRLPGRLVIGYLGRLSPDKGVPVLAEAVALLRQRGRDLTLLVAGEPRFVEPADARLVEQSLAALADVRRPGWMDRADFFASVDLAVFPSVWGEPFGLVAAEAMAARVPLVVSDTGALPEVVGPDCLRIARAGDATSLADAIEAALDSRDDRAVLDALHERWRRRYSPAAGRARMERLIDELSSTRTPR